MEKKYQLFISSTYVDLVEERKEVIQALLELDCIPVGMELFPAANEDQWTLIKELIDSLVKNKFSIRKLLNYGIITA